MRAIILVCAAFVLTADVTASARTARETRNYSQLAAAPEAASVRVNPVASDPAAVGAGRKLFERHCAACHGPSAEGGPKGPSLRVGEVQSASDGALFWVLTNGNVRAGMPVWSKLPEPQRWQVVSYVKSLGPSASEGRKAE